MPKNDEELIAAYLTGEESAFAELTERYLKPVYSFALRFVGSNEEAEDIAQETFVKAWKNLKKYAQEKSSFKTWLMRIARNSSIDYLRKKKHVPISKFDTEDNNVLVETIPDLSPLQDELFAKVEDASMVTHAIEELTPKHREILLLYYTNELTFEEIGAVLNEPPNTVKSRHRRALLNLRKILDSQTIESSSTKAPKHEHKTYIQA